MKNNEEEESMHFLLFFTNITHNLEKNAFIKDLMKKPQQVVCGALYSATLLSKNLQSDLEQEKKKNSSLENDKVKI